MTEPLPSVWRPADTDLDARIERVEQRLMAREQRLRDGASSLRHLWRRSLRPARALLPAGGLALGLLGSLALRALRGRAKPAPAPQAASSPLPWSRVLMLALPLLPARWRERPGVVAATGLLTAVAPWLATLRGHGATARHAPCPTPTAADRRAQHARDFHGTQQPSRH